MAMIKCENCKNDISDTASKCPYCNQERISSRYRVSKKVIAVCSSVVTVLVTVTTLILNLNNISNFYIEPNEVTLDYSLVNLYEGEKEAVYFSINPENASTKNIKFISDTPEVADVEEGNIIVAKQTGTAWIYQEGNEENFMAVYVGRPEIGWPTMVEGASITPVHENEEEYYFLISFYNSVGAFWIIPDDVKIEVTAEDNSGNVVYTEIFGTMAVEDNIIWIKIKKKDIPIKLPDEGKLSVRSYNGYMEEIQGYLDFE